MSINLFLKVLTDTFSLFSFNKAPAPVGEINVAREGKDEVVAALEMAAKECYANYGSQFQVAAVRTEEPDNVLNYRLFILFNYLELVKETKNDDGSMHIDVSQKIMKDFIGANKIVASTIERQKGDTILYMQE